jgi:uncharacterized RDD family membrane protein YckC
MLNVGTSRQLVAAGILERFIGNLIDGVVILVLTVLVRTLLAGSSATVASVILDALYYIGFWSSSGQTPGKVIMNTRIIDAQDGGLPRLSQAILRYIGTFISFFCLGLGYFWAIFDKYNQTWHDKIANTVVVKVK